MLAGRTFHLTVMVSAKKTPRGTDSMVFSLASAPPDDELSTPEEDAAAAEALAAYRRGEGIDSDELRAELDLGARRPFDPTPLGSS
jgi:hypothetical protein